MVHKMALKNSTAKWLLGAFVIVATVVGMSFLLLPSYAVYFYVPKEAVLQAATLHTRDIKVGGIVETGSVKWDAKSLDLQFTISDMDQVRITVSYKGTPPDMFKEGSGVVAEGRISKDGKTFRASLLMVKHSEEYRAPDDPVSTDRELLEKSLFQGGA